MFFFFFFQAEDGIRDSSVTGVQTCALPISKRFGDAPSVCVTEPGEHGPRRCRAERLDELLPEEPERDGIEQEHAFASEGDEPTLGNEMQQFVNIEIGGAHETSAGPFQNES